MAYRQANSISFCVSQIMSLHIGSLHWQEEEKIQTPSPPRCLCLFISLSVFLFTAEHVAYCSWHDAAYSDLSYHHASPAEANWPCLSSSLDFKCSVCSVLLQGGQSEHATATVSLYGFSMLHILFAPDGWISVLGRSGIQSGILRNEMKWNKWAQMSTQANTGSLTVRRERKEKTCKTRKTSSNSWMGVFFSHVSGVFFPLLGRGVYIHWQLKF